MFDEIPTYSSPKLLEAVEKAQRNLRSVLDNAEIKLVVLEESNAHQDIKAGYRRRWQNRDPQNWNIYFNSLTHMKDCFIVAIKSDDNLLGLCLFDIKDVATKEERLRIHAIERNEAHKTIKGLCIAAFCDVATTVAQALNIDKISVLQPHRDTKPSYIRLGFTPFNHNEVNHNEMDMPVSKDTSTDWPEVLRFRQQTAPPATP